VRAAKGLHPDRDDLDPGILVDLDHVLELLGLLEVGMNAAQLNRADADLLHELRHLRVVLEVAETVALDAKIHRCTRGHDHLRRNFHTVFSFPRGNRLQTPDWNGSRRWMQEPPAAGSGKRANRPCRVPL